MSAKKSSKPGSSETKLPNMARSNPVLNDPWVRVAVIFGFVIFFSFLAALTGCIAAGCYGRRRKTQQSKKAAAIGATGFGSSSQTPETSSTENSLEYDMEMLTQLNTIMANDTFKGREWSAYKREMRMKAKRRARGVMPTSQGIILPINIRLVKGKMRALSRSIIRSLTKSDSPQEIMEPAALNGIVQNLAKARNISRGSARELRPPAQGNAGTSSPVADLPTPAVEVDTTSIKNPLSHPQYDREN